MPVHNRPNKFENGALFLRLLSTVHTNPLRKRSFSGETALQTGGIWKRRLWVLEQTQHILNTELFENDGFTITMWFPCSSFPQTQIQNDRLLLRFSIPPA